MKRTILFALTIALSATFSSILRAQGPTPWYLTGNNVINSSDYLGANNASFESVKFKHFVNANSGRFEWWTNIGGSTSERMRLTNGGRLGLNTANPQMMFHVSEGGILSTGTTGNQPALNPGSRFIWVPGRRS